MGNTCCKPNNEKPCVEVDDNILNLNITCCMKTDRHDVGFEKAKLKETINVPKIENEIFIFEI